MRAEGGCRVEIQPVTVDRRRGQDVMIDHQVQRLLRPYALM